MSQVYDVIIIGAGVVGCSAAYHLSQLGFKTALIDQGKVGGGASGANFGMIQSDDVELEYSVPLVKAGYKRFDTLEEELGSSFHFRRVEHLSLIETQEQWDRWESRQKQLVAVGIPCEMAAAGDLTKIEPMVNPQGMLGAFHSTYQAQVNPFELMWAYLRPALSKGLDLYTYTRVTGFQMKSGRVIGVQTDRGDFSSPMTVLCTAAWTRPLGQILGQDWKISHFRGSAMVTQQVSQHQLRCIVTSASHIELPVTSSYDAEMTVLALTQTPEGNFLIAQANRPGTDLNSSISHVAPAAMAMMATRYFPVLRNLAVLRSWTAPTTFTEDGRPFVGPISGVEGILLATAFRSSFVLSPSAGEMVAQLVERGTSELDITPFLPDRKFVQADSVYQVRRESGQEARHY